MDKKADYQLSYSLNEGILEIVITGELTKEAIHILHSDDGPL